MTDGPLGVFLSGPLARSWARGDDLLFRLVSEAALYVHAAGPPRPPSDRMRDLYAALRSCLGELPGALEASLTLSEADPPLAEVKRELAGATAELIGETLDAILSTEALRARVEAFLAGRAG